jgi:hypothetical protein
MPPEYFELTAKLGWAAYCQRFGMSFEESQQFDHMERGLIKLAFG